MYKHDVNVATGTTAAESLINLQNWLDSIAERFSPGCRATDGEGQLLIGHYHKMKGGKQMSF